MGIGVREVDFLIIGSTDIDRSLDFYENVIGLRKTVQWGNMPAWEFETGNLTVAVVQVDSVGMTFRPNSPLALRVDDVAAARAELERKGVEFTRDSIDSGVCNMAFFEDPDGNALMLHHRYAPRES